MVTVEQILEGKRLAEQASLAFYQNVLKGQDQYACGFAWVDIFVDRTNSPQAKELIKAGFKKSYKGKCLEMWNPGGFGVQNIDCKEAGAEAMASYLKSLGLKAYVGSRMD
jgi:hypothetical protein